MLKVGFYFSVVHLAPKFSTYIFKMNVCHFKNNSRQCESSSEAQRRTRRLWILTGLTAQEVAVSESEQSRSSD